jgi:hypothetical protein
VRAATRPDLTDDRSRNAMAQTASTRVLKNIRNGAASRLESARWRMGFCDKTRLPHGLWDLVASANETPVRQRRQVCVSRGEPIGAWLLHA